MPGVEASILKHIFKQSQDYMAKEEDPRRVVPLSTLPDPRVDAVLYFLSPHYLKPQDVELMTRLSGFVPLIPIIAKVFDPLANFAPLVQQCPNFHLSKHLTHEEPLSFCP